MVMNALDFAKNNPNPTEKEVREALEGNLCRCTGYHNIVKGIVAGAQAMAK
jgi:carbon-monoxide dehydrogenase small subunit